MMIIFLLTFVLLQVSETISADSDWKAIAIGVSSGGFSVFLLAIGWLANKREKDKSEYMQSITAFQKTMGELTANITASTKVNEEIAESMKDLRRELSSAIIQKVINAPAINPPS